jgi:hypothetical protein
LHLTSGDVAVEPLSFAADDSVDDVVAELQLGNFAGDWDANRVKIEDRRDGTIEETVDDSNFLMLYIVFVQMSERKWDEGRVKEILTVGWRVYNNAKIMRYVG